MFMKDLFHSLWSLTIVGYFIKRYSYLMVPFILAENPDIGWRDAITLSRRIMDGYKWKAFIVDLSMWYWYLLKMLTAGFVGVFFLNPYSTSVYARIYATVRAAAYEKNIENITLLNDDALYLPVDMEARPIHPAAVKEAAEARKTYERSYSLINLILFFFTFSLVGWLWEVNIHLVKDHMFVNRGTMYGPWLPIYGAGGLLVLLVLKKIREKKVLTFIMTMIVCGITEYFTSWYLEYTKGTKWWDYSGYLLNINGRICLEGLLVFAIGGCAFIYFIAPKFDDLYNKIPLKVRWPIAGVLLAVFSADLVYSHFHPNEGEGITDYGYEYDSENMVSVAQPNEPARLPASQIPRLN